MGILFAMSRLGLCFVTWFLLSTAISTMAASGTSSNETPPLIVNWSAITQNDDLPSASAESFTAQMQPGLMPHSFAETLRTNTTRSELIQGYEVQFNLSSLIQGWSRRFTVGYTQFTDALLFPYDATMETTPTDYDLNRYIGGTLSAESHFDLGEDNRWHLGVGTYYGLPYGESMEAFGLQLTFRRQ